METASRRVEPVKTLGWWYERWREFLPGWRRFLPNGAVTFIWTGLLLLLIAAGFWLHSWLFMRRHTRAIGTVTENVAIYAVDGTVYTTHLRFRLPDGQLVNAVDPVMGSPNSDPDFKAGSDIPILYPPGQPQKAFIATAGRLYFGAIVFGVLGAFIMDMGLIFRLILRRQARSSLDTAGKI
jgi:hypothetical protein